jgi:hypothetical protein
VIELVLGQWMGARVLDRVLRREQDERARELVRDRVRRHIPLLHGVEQPGLRLRRRPVDLVDQHEVGEYRTGLTPQRISDRTGLLDYSLSGSTPR